MIKCDNYQLESDLIMKPLGLKSLGFKKPQGIKDT